jgi:hypothetical protein
MDHHQLVWFDTGLEPREAPDLRYPRGVELDVTNGKRPACLVELPYPALRLGAYVVMCDFCGMKVGCATAGRADDPRSIRIPCKL